MLIEVDHFMEEIPYLALPRGRQLSNIENETLQANNRSSSKTRLVKFPVVKALATYCLYNNYTCTQMHQLQQSHCGDNWEGILFS